MKSNEPLGKEAISMIDNPTIGAKTVANVLGVYVALWVLSRFWWINHPVPEGITIGAGLSILAFGLLYLVLEGTQELRTILRTRWSASRQPECLGVMLVFLLILPSICFGEVWQGEMPGSTTTAILLALFAFAVVSHLWGILESSEGRVPLRFRQSSGLEKFCVGGQAFFGLLASLAPIEYGWRDRAPDWVLVTLLLFSVWVIAACLISFARWRPKKAVTIEEEPTVV